MTVDQQNSAQTIQDAVRAARLADVVIAVIAEKPYAELPGDIPDISFDPLQMEFVQQLQATNKPVILVILEGRPRVLPQNVISNSSAIILGIFPGPDGGIPIAEVCILTATTSYANPCSNLDPRREVEPKWTIASDLPQLCQYHPYPVLAQAFLQRCCGPAVGIRIRTLVLSVCLQQLFDRCPGVPHLRPQLCGQCLCGRHEQRTHGREVHHPRLCGRRVPVDREGGQVAQGLLEGRSQGRPVHPRQVCLVEKRLLVHRSRRTAVDRTRQLYSQR